MAKTSTKSDPRRERIAAERELLRTRLRQMRAQLDDTAGDGIESDVSFSEEDGEGATTAVSVDALRAQIGRTQDLIVELDAAEGRLDDGSYGICDGCGERIADARLEALPATTVCVTCKTGGLSRRR